MERSNLWVGHFPTSFCRFCPHQFFKAVEKNITRRRLITQSKSISNPSPVVLHNLIHSCKTKYICARQTEKGLAADMHLHFQTCTFRHLHFRKWRHLQSFLFFILLSIFKLNLSTFYTSIQVVKTWKKKLNYEVACNCYLHS